MKYWLYYVARSALGFPFKVFFKSIQIDGLKNIPNDKPILFIASHSGSFLDGSIIAKTNRIKVFSLARGDAFNKPLPNKLLRSMAMLPIYRGRDADVEKARLGNEKTYDESYELFSKGNRILIFPEANSFPEKTIRPIKKGSANMVADMILRGKGDLDLYIVPVGLNYSHFGSYRIRLHVNYGSAIRALDFHDEIKAHPRLFGRNFTKKLEEELKKVTVKTVGDFEQDKEFVHHLALNEFDDQSQYRKYDTGSVAIPQIVDRVDAAHKEMIDKYEALLRTNGVKDRNVASGSINLWIMLLAFCTIAVSLPAAMLYKVVWVIARKNSTKVIKNVVFYDSMHFGLGLIGTYVWIILLAVITYVVLPDHWTTTWQTIGLIAAIAGAPAWFTTVEELQHFFYELRFYSLGKEKINALRSLRAKLIDSLK